jgi:hypothetical protein
MFFPHNLLPIMFLPECGDTHIFPRMCCQSCFFFLRMCCQ